MEKTGKFDINWVWDDLMATSNFTEAIRRTEQALAAITPKTPYHAMAGRDFLPMLDQACQWLMSFCDAAVAETNIESIYAEMNSFDYNTDEWRVDGFAFAVGPQGAVEDLGEYAFCEFPQLTVRGFEDIQQAYETYGVLTESEAATPDLEAVKDAQAMAFNLVAFHMTHLLVAARRKARTEGHPVGALPLLIGVHDFAEPYLAED